MRTKIGVLTCTSWALKLSLSTMEMSTAGVDASIGRLALVCAFCPGEPSSEASGPSKVVSTSTAFSAKPPKACKAFCQEASCPHALSCNSMGAQTEDCAACSPDIGTFQAWLLH